MRALRAIVTRRREEEEHVEEDDLDVIENENAEALAKLRAFLRVVFGVALYGALPALLVWALSAARDLNLLSPLIDAGVQQRLGRLGLFLGAVAAIIATESLTRLNRPFGLGPFFLTVTGLGVAMFPFLAARHEVTFGLSEQQVGLVLSYAYLVVEVAVGLLVGAIMSWILLAHGDPEPLPLRPRYTPRK
jgi:hypothetical protein